MNIALGALIILLLLLPALFFRFGITMVRFRFSTKDANKSFSFELAGRNFINILSKLNFSETLFFFSVVPLLLHAVSICILHFFNKEIDYALLLNVLSSQKDIVKNNLTFNTELTSFLWYIIILTILGFLLGLFLTNLIVRIPNSYMYLIGENHYLRLFTGLLLEPTKRAEVDLILVDVVCETKEVTVIYSGFLEKFDVIPDKNELAYITLTGARRRDLRKYGMSKDITASEKHTSYENDSGDMIVIPGKYFTIIGNKVSNVNVTYMNLQQVTNSTTQQLETVMVPVQ